MSRTRRPDSASAITPGTRHARCDPSALPAPAVHDLPAGDRRLPAATGPLTRNVHRRLDLGAIEEAVAALAARQHGVVTRRQLLEAGLTSGRVDRWLSCKRLRQLHRGIYVVGPVVAPRAREMAAVLACSRGGVISHHTAGSLRDLIPVIGRRPVDVSVVGGADVRRSGIRVHRVRSLVAEDVSRLDGIPITTVGRTLCDLAGVMESRELERALAEALARRLTTKSALMTHIERNVGRPGVGRLRALVESEAPPSRTRSEAEERLLAMVRSARLPEPAVNVKVAGYEVDFLWDTARLVVEVDGFAFHSSARRFESDRRRDAALAAAGMRVVRVTWRQLTEERDAVLAGLAQAIAASAR